MVSAPYLERSDYVQCNDELNEYGEPGRLIVATRLPAETFWQGLPLFFLGAGTGTGYLLYGTCSAPSLNLTRLITEIHVSLRFLQTDDCRFTGVQQQFAHVIVEI